MKFSLIAIAAATFTDAKKKDDMSFRSVCPVGFRLSASDKCTKTLTSPATMRCSHGLLMNGMCLSRHVVAPELSCPVGQSLHEQSICRECSSVDAVPQCPEFFLLEGSVCVKREMKAADLICDKGSLFGRVCECTERVDAIRRCLEGFELVEDGSRCEKEEIRDAIFACEEEGFALVDGSCVMETRRASDQICDGSEEEDKCFAEKHTAAERHCPSLGEPDACYTEERQPKEPVCPPGYNPSTLISRFGGQLCELCREDRHKALAKCEYLPALRGCSGDFINMGGEDCVKRTYTRPEFSCAEGKSLRFGTDGHPYCSEKVETAFQITCGETEKFDGLDCVSVTVGPSSRSCPPGFILDGEKCLRTVVDDVLLTCQQGGVMIDGQCEFTTALPPRVECPLDFERSSGDNCERKTTVSVRDPCPSPDHTLVDGRCTLCSTSTPTPSCPSEAKLIHSSKRTFCFSVKEEPAQPSCLNGWSPSGPTSCTTAVVVTPTAVWNFRKGKTL